MGSRTPFEVLMRDSPHPGTPRVASVRILRYNEGDMKRLLFALCLLACTPLTNAPHDALSDSAVPVEAAAVTQADANITIVTTSVSYAVTWDVHFSPDGGCTDSVVALINSSNKTIRIQAYGFTSQPIADALVRAKQRGVDVRGIFDKSDKTALGSKVTLLTAAGIPAWYDSKHAIAHNKVLIVDGLKTETGSFNFTANAEKGNAENCLVLTDPDPTDAKLAKAYTANWETHLSHSEPVH